MEELTLFPDRPDLAPPPGPRKVAVRAHERTIRPRLTPTERQAHQRRQERAQNLAEIARLRRKLDRTEGP